MEKDYIKILYEEWLEHLTKEPKMVTAANKAFHQYVERCQQLKQEERNHISNYNGDCIAACEAFSFQAGFETEIKDRFSNVSGDGNHILYIDDFNQFMKRLAD